jgi:regulator of sigma E protease
MDLLGTIFYFLITIGILVLVHELGHFFAAKLTGMRIDRFSLGFPPRAFGKKFGDTDYCISWIPIGGYVKIAGMIDESMDTEFLNKPPEPWEFRSKPFIAKFFVMIAGVLMNILLAIIIFWTISYHQGKIIKETTTVSYVAEKSAAQKAGLLPSDKIVSINGNKISEWDEINNLIYIDDVNKDIAFEIIRNNRTIDLTLSRKDIKTFSDEQFGIYPKESAALISGVEVGKPAESLGLKPGDIFYTINNEKIFNDFQVRTFIKSNPGKEVKISWIHGTDTLSGTTVPTRDGKIGIALATIYTGSQKRIDYTILEALPEGIKGVYIAVKMFVYSMDQLITGKTKFSQSFGGPVKIAQMATQSAEMGWLSFMAFVALLSMSLAIINIIPFPALDGGHIVFLIIEAIIRREIPTKAKLIIQQAGFFILLAFMAFVIYNDIINF